MYIRVTMFVSSSVILWIFTSEDKGKAKEISWSLGNNKFTIAVKIRLIAILLYGGTWFVSNAIFVDNIFLEFSDIWFNAGVLTSNEGTVNSVHDYSQWGDITETMSGADTCWITCYLVVTLQKAYLLLYNKRDICIRSRVCYSEIHWKLMNYM